jgi:hypothetical protein
VLCTGPMHGAACTYSSRSVYKRGFRCAPCECALPKTSRELECTTVDARSYNYNSVQHEAQHWRIHARGKLVVPVANTQPRKRLYKRAKRALPLRSGCLKAI